MDMKSCFLHGDFLEEVHIDNSPKYMKKGKEHLVYGLNKALYGLKQVLGDWYEKIHIYFLNTRFLRSLKK